MAINLNNVNISLRQFQDISTGEYNAGEVKLKSESSIGKVNHHVTMRRFNKVDISHEEVLAIKNAFVKALASGGVDQYQLDFVRKELGLAPMKPVDKTLHERSVKPLSRQQIRDILDRNRNTINSTLGEGTIRTVQQVYPRMTNATLNANRTNRENVNAELETRRSVIESNAINTLQSVLAGDVDFFPRPTRKEMLSTARECLDATLMKCNGEPRDNVKAEVKWSAAGGSTVLLSTGLSEKAFVRHLEDIIVRLSIDNSPYNEELDYRAEFKALASQQDRTAWANSLDNDPQAARKARVVAVMILNDRGIFDAETLSTVNKLNDANAIAFAKNLVSSAMDLEGDALRGSAPVMAALANADPDLALERIEKAYIPALTANEFNEKIYSYLQNAPKKLPATFRLVQTTASFAVRARYGAAGLPNNTSAVSLIDSKDLAALIGKDNPNAARATPEAIRQGYIDGAIKAGAIRLLESEVRSRLESDGVKMRDGTFLLAAISLRQRHPEALQRIIAAENEKDAKDVLNDFKDQIAQCGRRMAACDRGHHSLDETARRAMAEKLGVSVSSLPESHFTLRNLKVKGNALRTAVCNGSSALDSDAEIEAGFKDLVEKFVDERVKVLAQIDACDIPDEAKYAFKSLVLKMDKVNYLDIKAIVDSAKAISTDKLARLLQENAPADQIFAEMHEIHIALDNGVNKMFEAAIKAGKEVGPDEMSNFLAPVVEMAVLLKPGLEANLAKFLASEAVAGQNVWDEEDKTHPAANFMAFAPNPDANAFLASQLGTDDLPALYVQALKQAARDEGMGELSTAEVKELFNPTRPSGAILKDAVTETKDTTIKESSFLALARAALRQANPIIAAAQQNRQAVELAAEAFKKGQGATRALESGYHKSEIPRLAKAFALYKTATNCTDEVAIAVLLDPQSKASRLMGYGGRFAESTENFRAGLELMDKFADWFANLAADVGAKKLDTPTKWNASSTFVLTNAVRGYEMFVFQDIAINPNIRLDKIDVEKFFGVGQNDAVNFFSRGSGSGCTGTLVKLSPAKRQVVYAAFRALLPPKPVGERNGPTTITDSGLFLARILRHFDEVAALKAEGKLDRTHLNAILTPDLNLPPNAAPKVVSDAINDRIHKKYSSAPDKLLEAGQIMASTGCTVTELMDALETGKELPILEDFASTTMKIEQIDGTTNGGREFMLADLGRPAIPSFAASGEGVITGDNAHFRVKIGEETIVCAFGGTQVNAHVADKIEAFCGKVHVEQANTVMRGLSQGGHGPFINILSRYGIKGGIGAEHSPLTYTLTKNDETGAITIRYSEPEGFPFKFSWETTVALDGTSTTTPVVSEANPGLGYKAISKGGATGPFTSNTIAPGEGPAATAFRNIVDTRGGAPADASPTEKAQAFANKVNVRGAKELSATLGTVASRNLVVMDGDQKKLDFNSVFAQFDRDLHGAYRYYFPGVKGASTDYNTNRDHLVRFVTNDKNANFATASDATKRKVGILMALLTQYTSTLSADVVSLSSAANNSATGFATGGDFTAESTGTDFRLSKDADGNIKIVTSHSQSVKIITTFGENNEPSAAFVVGKDSYLSCEIEITLPQDNLETLANADWTKYDREAINTYAGDVDGRIALISPEFRFNGTVNISYHMHLNEDGPGQQPPAA